VEEEAKSGPGSEAGTYITDTMRAAIGSLISRQVSFPVSESDIRRWALAVYWPETPPRLFWDREYAAATIHRGIVAPEEFNPFAWMPAHREARQIPAVTNDPNRVERLLGIDGPELANQLNGGLDCEYGVRMRPGDVITEESRLADYDEREGRLGRMLLSVYEDVWTNQSGQLVKRSRMTHIRY
jgi:hypothetical protein